MTEEEITVGMLETIGRYENAPWIPLVPIPWGTDSAQNFDAELLCLRILSACPNSKEQRFWLQVLRSRRAQITERYLREARGDDARTLFRVNAVLQPKEAALWLGQARRDQIVKLNFEDVLPLIEH